MKQRAYGFTLIEILVAMVIVAVIGVLAYGGLHGLIREREQTATSMQRLRLVQQALAIMTRDFSQLVARPVRDPLGGTRLAAFLSTPQNQPPLIFTRGGWSNPLADVRSTEERVAYQMDNDQLLRFHGRNWMCLRKPNLRDRCCSSASRSLICVSWTAAARGRLNGRR